MNDRIFHRAGEFNNSPAPLHAIYAIKPEFRKKLTSLSRLFATDRWFQFHKPREFFIGTHNEAFSDAIRSFYHATFHTADRFAHYRQQLLWIRAAATVVLLTG